MRCKGCNRDIEVRWWTPEGCDAPVLEDLCGWCNSWSKSCLQAISKQEDEDFVVHWPKKAALGADLMVAPTEHIQKSGVHAVNADLGYVADVHQRAVWDGLDLEGADTDEDAP